MPFDDILSLCREAGNPDMVYEFASTSKVTLPRRGHLRHGHERGQSEVHAEADRPSRPSPTTRSTSCATSCYLKDKAHTLELMKKHAAHHWLRSSSACCAISSGRLPPLGIASWERPKGGYFVSCNTVPGLAKRTLALCKRSGRHDDRRGRDVPVRRSTRRIPTSASRRPCRRSKSWSRQWRSSRRACASPRWNS